MRRRAAIAIAMFLFALPAASQDGRAIAERWCAGCHAIGEGQTSAPDAAPSLPAIAKARDDAQLAGWLAAPHPPMPDPGLSRAQIDALVDWLRTLRD